MGLLMRDNRQMKALTGLSQDQFDDLLPVFSNIYQARQQKTYEDGVRAGQRKRQPGGGAKGKLPTMADKLQFVLYYYKTYPTFDVLGQQFDMARSKANENLPDFSARCCKLALARVSARCPMKAHIIQVLRNPHWTSDASS